MSGSRGAVPWIAVLALLLAAVVTLPWLGARDLWAPDEPRYAEVAREALVDGHWWYPHVNGRPYPDKPPLYFWLAAAASTAEKDVDERTARLPSAIAALLLVLVVMDLGTRLLGAEAGGMAGLVMATTWLSAWMSRRVNLDVLLSLLVATCLWCGVRGALRSRADGSSAGQVAWMAAAGVAAALAIMTKGPVALLFVAAALLPMAVESRRAGLRVPTPAKIATGAAFVVVLAAWLIPARMLGGYDPIAVVREHVVERAAEGRDHVQPAWYFLKTVPIDFLPWTLFAIPAMVAAWRARREPSVSWLLSWAIAPLVVLSVIVEKRNIYVLPLLPAWALLVGWWVARSGGVGGSRGLRRAVVAAAGLAAALAVATLVAGRIPRVRDFVLELPDAAGFRRDMVLAGALGLAGSAAIFALLRWRAHRAALVACVAAAFATIEIATFRLLPRLDVHKSGREMGMAILREAGWSAPLGMYPRTWDAYVFYSRRTIVDLTSPERAVAWLACSPRPAFVVAYARDERVIRALPGAPVVVARDRVGHREVVLWKFAGNEP